MSQEDRRSAIVESTVPLLLEHGGSVTTSQIAAAAGIAEGTIFRAFRDKQELIVACVRAGMRADHAVDGIHRIPRELPLTERLAAALDVVGGYLDRMWSLMQALHALGVRREALADRDTAEEDEHRGPEEMMRVAAATAELFGPDADSLRTTPELAARLLLGLVFSNRMQGRTLGRHSASSRELVDLFLHGAIGAGGEGTQG